MIGLEGDLQYIKSVTREIKEIFKDFAPVNMGTTPGSKWLKDRFYLPYIRDEFMDNGVLVDTLETATTWSNLHHLYQKVRAAIIDSFSTEHRALVYCHISHSYTDGASLYFSIIALQDKADPMAQWQKMKHAANRAILENGGVISHHHGIGLDHIEGMHWDQQQINMIGDLQRTVDPKSIINPGKLF